MWGRGPSQQAVRIFEKLPPGGREGKTEKSQDSEALTGGHKTVKGSWGEEMLPRSWL